MKKNYGDGKIKIDWVVLVGVKGASQHFPARDEIDRPFWELGETKIDWDVLVGVKGASPHFPARDEIDRPFWELGT